VQRAFAPMTINLRLTLRVLQGNNTGMRPLDHVAHLDRRWFSVHPERHHRCRRPDVVELDLRETDYGRLLIAIRHLGARRLAYQPVIYDGPTPLDERTAEALFALAAYHPDPIPVISKAAVQRCRTRAHDPA
jgi:hypothetical protein